jgi:septal ring factor EnvC (AmiA/AmiB activator)
VSADFARELERELAVVWRERSEFAKRIDEADATLAQRTAERDALAEEVDRLRLQVEISDHCVAVLKAERDEARRDLCVSQAVDYLCETNPDEPISYDETRRIAAEFAAERGWDCFDAPHATDGRVQNGGA